MKLFKKILITSLLALFTINISTVNAEDSELIRSSETYWDYFDTVITISIWDEEEFTVNEWLEVESILRNIQDTFSRTDETSELYLLNQKAGSGEWIQISEDLFELIQQAIKFAEETNGKFEPTIGPLVEAWAINTDFPRVPSNEEINQIKPLLNYELIELSEETNEVRLPQDGMIIDLGGIAKGYAADKVKAHLTQKGVKHAIINLGGNILSIGERYKARDNGLKAWSFGIRDPQSNQADDAIARVFLIDKTIVTSGIYERKFFDNDTQQYYHHILDPDTGYPVDNTLASVTIITDSSTTADALSTSVFALGLENGKEYVESLEGVDAVFITIDNEIIKTDGIDQYHFELLKDTTNDNKTNNNMILYGVGLGGIIIVTTVIIVIIMTSKKYK